MAQDAKIMAAAHRRFQADREARQAELERRIEEIHRRLPRVEAIDRELGSTAARLVLAECNVFVRLLISKLSFSFDY